MTRTEDYWVRRSGKYPWTATTIDLGKTLSDTFTKYFEQFPDIAPEIGGRVRDGQPAAMYPTIINITQWSHDLGLLSLRAEYGIHPHRLWTGYDTDVFVKTTIGDSATIAWGTRSEGELLEALLYLKLTGRNIGVGYLDTYGVAGRLAAVRKERFTRIPELTYG